MYNQHQRQNQPQTLLSLSVSLFFFFLFTFSLLVLPGPLSEKNKRNVRTTYSTRYFRTARQPAAVQVDAKQCPVGPLLTSCPKAAKLKKENKKSWSTRP